MLKEIFKKEWLKLKFYVFGLFIIAIFLVGYFLFDLNFLFSTIEPESMMWYKLSILGLKPYDDFIYLFILNGFVLSFAQFLPEMINSRIKILLHLPYKIHKILFLHLRIGVLFVVVLNVFLAVLLLGVMGTYYPSIALVTIFQDLIIYTFISVVAYLFISAVIIDKNKIIASLKLLLLALFPMAFIKNQYVYFDLIYLFVLFFTPFIVLDSLYSVKQQRLHSIAFRVVLFLLVCFLFSGAYANYKQNYKNEFAKYYIFYSNILKEFVYQKNYGDHNFEYGIKDKKVIDQKEYESYLPFVYWRNLDIQKKLPVIIDEKEYSKKVIKSSRLSFSYHPKYLKEKEIKLFPLFNPKSDKGMIKFPEEMIAPSEDKIQIYSYDTGIDKDLSETLNQILEKKDIKYPIVNIWGKPTNMKPHDKGYLIEDKKHTLYNLKRYDDIFDVKKINYPKELNLSYINISENKQQLLSGYAIGKDSSFYLLSWDFNFKKLELPDFDHKSMKLKLISNPINYLIRYDDGKNYYAVVFDKDLKFIKSTKFEDN